MQLPPLPRIEVVIHVAYGAFMLTETACQRFNELATDMKIFADWKPEWDKQTPEGWCWYDVVPRHHPALIQVIRELGDAAHPSGNPQWGKRFEIQEISLAYEIEEWDGAEKVVRG